jgi:hypothetical protein
MPQIDDREFRAAAKRLLLVARRTVPAIDLAAQVVEKERGFLVLEVTLDRDGPLRSSILLDLGGPEQTVLHETNGRE